MNASQIVNRCDGLKKSWSARNTRFKEWYRQIQQVDELEQDGMESFTSSDPRSSYNLLLHMLNSPRIPHRIPPELVTPELVGPASDLSKLLDTAWLDIHKRYRYTGHQGWMRDFIGLMLATGWYSVFAYVRPDGTGMEANIWNPATVFPSWDELGLSEVAHIYSISPEAITRVAAKNNWDMLGWKPTTSQTLYDYWYLDSSTVVNSVVIGNYLIKPETPEPQMHRLPIFINPVGGLPDTGVISNDANWRAEIGQSSVATAEKVYRSMNKWWTYSMQLLRDTAQSRWYEKTSSAKPILKPEDIYKRGFIARLGPNDEIGPLPVPPIPVEMRAMQLDMEAMLQRAGPPWALFGTSTSGMTAYMMSQIASGASQLAQPFHQGVIDCLSDIDNFWLTQIRNFHHKPYGVGYPKNLPDELEVTASYEIKIPGDIIQRATVARMLNPTFQLSYSRVSEELFPEIKNPAEEKAQVRSDQAQSHPVFAYVDLIQTLRAEADKLRKTNSNGDTIKLYELAAKNIEAQLAIQSAPSTPATGSASTGSLGSATGARSESGLPNRETQVQQAEQVM